MIEGVETDNRTVQSRRGICSICDEKEALYTCPGCYINSCSLFCIKQHKEYIGCTGVRDKVAFVSIREYNESNLLSDYRFLEDLNRRNNAARRELQSHLPKSNIEHRRTDIRMTAQRRRIQVAQLPITFSRSKRNKTFCQYRYLHWTVELTFVHSGVKFIEDGVYENTTLEKVLQKVLDDPIKRQRLKLYVEGGGLEKMKVLMASRKYHDMERRGFYALDIKKSLQDNLRGNYVIEFPEFIIILEDKLSDYKIMTPKETKTTDPFVEMDRIRERRGSYRGKRGGKEAKKRKWLQAAEEAAKHPKKEEEISGGQEIKDQPEQKERKPSEDKQDEAAGSAESKSEDKGVQDGNGPSGESGETEPSQGKDDSKQEED